MCGDTASMYLPCTGLRTTFQWLQVADAVVYYNARSNIILIIIITIII